MTRVEKKDKNYIHVRQNFGMGFLDLFGGMEFFDRRLDGLGTNSGSKRNGDVC